MYFADSARMTTPGDDECDFAHYLLGWARKPPALSRTSTSTMYFGGLSLLCSGCNPS
jgi:hypothetical protein